MKKNFNTKYIYLLSGAMGLLLSQVGYAEGSAKLTDPQIAAIVVTANSVDVTAGQLATKSTKNKEVKKFAEQMVNDHTSVNKSAVELVTKLNVKPEENDTSRGLQKGGDENIANLKKLKGKAFDKAYVDQEVAYHETVLGAIDTALIPSATNTELKALLEKVRPAIAAHLEHAKHIQSTLK